MINIPNSIFPKNNDGDAICGQCQKLIKACTCPSYDPSKPKNEQFFLVMRVDHRKGKEVVVIEGLPNDTVYCKELARVIRKKSGSGGTSYINNDSGVIEIQGQKIELIQQILTKEGFVQIKLKK